MDLIKGKIEEVFEKCQERRYNLAKLAELLKKFFLEISANKDQKNEFHTQFLYCVECMLQDADRDTATERCVQFIAIFSAHFADTSDEEEVELMENDDENLYDLLINHIIQPEMHCHSNKTIRFRICQLLQLLLNAVPQNAALDEDLMESATKVLLDRIKDKTPNIRAQAAKSLNRLQQPCLPGCPVIEVYLFHLAYDDSPQVRAAVLSNISLTTKTLPCVVDRTRDVSENVRKIAFQTIAHKVSIKALTSSQRLYLIRQGLMDRSEVVREVVKKQLFQAWLLTFDASLIDLLKTLDVVSAYETCCKAVVAMFQCSSLNDLMEGFVLLNEKKVIDFDKLTPEAAVYWSQMCEYMRKKGTKGDQHLDNLQPNPLVFAEYLDHYTTEVLFPFMEKGENNLSPQEEDDKIEKEFVAEQLIKIAIGMDMSDNAGRKAINEVFRKVIASLDVICFPCLIPPLSFALLELHSGNMALEKEEEDKVMTIATLVSSSREQHSSSTTIDPVLPSEDEAIRIKQEIAKLSVLLNIANDELAKQVAAKDFVRAGETQQEIDEVTAKRTELMEKLKPNSSTPSEDSNSPLLEKSDPGTIVKCLLMVKELLSSLFECRCNPKRAGKSIPRGIHPTLLQLLETLVIPSVLNPSPEVRRQAIRCLGVGCMFSTALAARHFHLLIQVAQADIYVVRVAAVNAVNDLIRLFGVKTLAPNKEAVENQETRDDQSSPSTSKANEEFNDVNISEVLVDKFIEMLDDEELEVREAATSLLTRVLVSHRIISPAAVSRLVLLWYNPATRDNPSILNSISLFLDLFPYMSKEAHECIEAAFLPVLRVLFNAPRTSPFASVNISNVAELLVTITRPSIIEKANLKGICENRNTKWLSEWSAHDDFAVMLCNEVLGDPTSPYVNTLCKILPMLDLNPKLADNLKDIEVLCANLLKDVKDKQAIRHIRKFETYVGVLMKQNKCGSNTEVNEVSEKDNEGKDAVTALVNTVADQEESHGSPALKQINTPDPMQSKRVTRKTTRSKKQPSPVSTDPRRNLSDAFVAAAK